jgi:hypothetical protein
MGCQASSGKQRAAAGDVETATGGSSKDGTIAVVVAETSAEKDGPSQELETACTTPGVSAGGSSTSEAKASTTASNGATASNGGSSPGQPQPQSPRGEKSPNDERRESQELAGQRLSAVSKGSSRSGNGRHKVPKSMSVVKRK